MSQGTFFGYLSVFDATKFKPFRIFTDYYIHYSTWLGAIWPYGVITLLVIYGGSDFLSWVRTRHNEESALVMPMGIVSNSPKLTFTFYALDETDNGITKYTQAFNDRDFSIRFYQCTEEKVLGADGDVTVIANGEEYTVTGPTVNVTRTCDRINLKCASGSSCTLPAQSLALSGCETCGGNRTYIEARLSTCVEDDEYNSTRSHYENCQTINPCPPSIPDQIPGTNDCCNFLPCNTANEIITNVKSGLLTVKVNSPMDDKVVAAAGLENLPFAETYILNVDVERLYMPNVILRTVRLRQEPSYWGSASVYEYAQQDRIESAYSDKTDETFMRFNVKLDNQALFNRFVPVSLLYMIARFGQLIAGLALINHLVYKVNMLSFYAVANETFYVPDIGTRKFLLTNKKIRIKEYENMLIYAFTFGGVERFGLQTRHLYDFFNNKQNRFSHRMTQMVVEDIQKFMMEKRIGGFVNEEAKVERADGAVDMDYDIALVAKPSSSGAASAAKIDDELGEEGVSSGTSVVREVETTLKIAILNDELSKLKAIAATLFPQQAKKFKLTEKLNSATEG